MSLFLYSLKKCGKLITINDRDMKMINGLPTEVFSNPLTLKAIIKTVSGVKVFDSTNTETVITHKISIPYDATVTAEKFILFNGKRIRIVTVKNCCEKDDQLIMLCTERGLDSKIVNSA